MSLIDPAVQRAEKKKRAASNLSKVAPFVWVMYFLVAVGAVMADGYMRHDSHTWPQWGHWPFLIAGTIVVVIVAILVIGSMAALAALPGGIAFGICSGALGMAVGIYVADHVFGNPSGMFGTPSGALMGKLWPPLIVAGIAFVLGLMSNIHQKSLASLAKIGTPHEAIMHAQGYSEATWEEYSATTTTVTLSFQDRIGNTRYVERQMTQYKDNPIPDGTPVTMFWDPNDPSNEKRIVFSRELGGQTLYF
ncbi:MAG: hypothetical protein Q4G30_04155 [Actinomycetaceae bacterium]|nr:hypothetical protein [Actinomycetaceae bacterium]